MNILNYNHIYETELKSETDLTSTDKAFLVFVSPIIFEYVGMLPCHLPIIALKSTIKDYVYMSLVTFLEMSSYFQAKSR